MFLDEYTGDKVVGTVFSIDQRGAYVDIGAKGAAFVPNDELSLSKVDRVSTSLSTQASMLRQNRSAMHAVLHISRRIKHRDCPSPSLNKCAKNILNANFMEELEFLRMVSCFFTGKQFRYSAESCGSSGRKIWDSNKDLLVGGLKLAVSIEWTLSVSDVCRCRM